MIAARLPHSDVIKHGSFATAAIKNFGEQWQSNLLLLGDQQLLANEQQLNRSRNQRLANERLLNSLATEGSESIRRRMKRKILRFDVFPQKKWPLPIKYKIEADFSGKMAARNVVCSHVLTLLHCIVCTFDLIGRALDLGAPKRLNRGQMV
jgi:hypothetical protein